MRTIDKKNHQDPLNYFSTEELAKMGDSVKGLSTTELMNQRQQVSILKNRYRNYASMQNPTSTTIFENATVTKIDMLNVRRSATGSNFIAREMEKEGKKEAETILEKFSQNFYGDKILRDVEGLNPIASIKKYNEFEKSKPLSVTQAEAIVRDEEQFERLQQRVGIEVPSSGNRSILDEENGYLANFKNKETQRALLKSCIPCDFRNINLSATASSWDDLMKDFNKNWKEFEKKLRSLAAFKAGQFSTDLCNLFKFLDGQCIPDLTGLISLLSLMQLKYMNLHTTSMENIMSQLIAPLLSPIVGSFTSNLDQYLDVVIGPLRCVSDALEKQIINLQDQINGAYNIADMNSTKFRMAELDFYDAKIKALRNRKIQIEREKNEKNIRSIGGTRADIALDGNTLAPDPYPTLKPGEKLDLTRRERIVQTKLINGGVRLTGQSDSFLEKGFQNAYGRGTITFDEELKKINDEIDLIQKKKNGIKDKIKEIKAYDPINLSGTVSMNRSGRAAIDNFQMSFKSLIGNLVDKVNSGINLVKDSIDVYREELQRLILGRISTQEDQIEFTRFLQEISQLMSVVHTILELKKRGSSLKKLCGIGEQNALSQVAQGISSNGNGMFNFYQAQDSEGRPLMVIAPGGAKVNVSSIDFSDVKDDALFGDSSFDLDAVTKTVSLNDLNEVEKLNREGIVPDLGNIDGKLIELSNKTKVGSELDLHFKNSYAIISSEFCSKSAISFGSSDTVKQWAASLWQKN
jgi:hypothetical protein